MYGRPLNVKILALRIRSNQTARIPRFEFMRVDLQRFKIAYPKMTCACFEVISKRQRAKRRVTSGASAINHRSIWISLGPGGEKLCSIDAVVDIDHTPGAVQPFAIGAAVTGAAAIVH